MKNMQKLMAVVLATLTFAAAETVCAQRGGGGFGGGGGGFGGRNMDTAQLQEMIQQRMSESYRQQMGVTNDEEWAIIEQRIAAVTKAQSAMSADGSGMGGLSGLLRTYGGRGGGGFGGGGAGMMGNLFGRPSPESEALQKAIDQNAPAAQIRVLMDKFVAARRQKEEALVRAQEDLRQVLTTRQEAVALVSGLL